MEKRLVLAGLICLASLSGLSAQEINLAGATERTPSRSQYFSWINNTNEGPNEAQTMTNLAFFRFLHDNYGMRLDIYAFDAGAIDGSKRYGSMETEEFRSKFPHGFGSISEYAAQTDTKLGLWCGPDGFGDTDEQAAERSEMMVSLVRDYNFRLFKMDGVCGPLRPEKYECFTSMMSEVRKYAPDLVLLNHRLDLGPGTKYSTTYLMGGKETYIDVHMFNDVTAPHHRAKALEREVPPTRLTEDHGVCISSCLDYWDDDLILQAFNRNLILAPEIYGNPWLLRDDEFPQLAFIYNLHRDYRDILVDGVSLPETKYGPYAMSRGDGSTMFITLRNLSWETVKYSVKLDSEVGLEPAGDVKVRMYHPYIEDLGTYRYGSIVDVEVLPFRSCLVKVTTEKEKDNVLVSGVPYRIINDRVGDTCTVRLMGLPGQTYKYTITAKNGVRRKATVTFPGEKLRLEPLRHVSSMQRCDNIPEDIPSIYYATVFAADNNCYEYRSLCRSGETSIPQVKAARDAFFHHPLFIDRGICDRNLFDNDPSTFFNISMRWGELRANSSSQFMLDFGEAIEIDSLKFSTDSRYSLSPLKYLEGNIAYVSGDLKTWKEITFIIDTEFSIDLSQAGRVRYLRFGGCPLRLAEVKGYRDGIQLSSDQWHASNLFDAYGRKSRGTASRVWKSEFVLDEIADNAYLCVAVNGECGSEGAWAGFKIDDRYVGCPDRSPSYVSNTWECKSKNKGTEGNYTFYLPLTPDMKGKKVEAYVFSMDWAESYGDLTPEIWISAYPLPFKSEDRLIRNASIFTKTL